MLCLVCASHNGVSESEALDLLPDLELPLLLFLLERLSRLCVVTLRCGLIRFQHLQVSRPRGTSRLIKVGLKKSVPLEKSLFGSAN